MRRCAQPPTSFSHRTLRPHRRVVHVSLSCVAAASAVSIYRLHVHRAFFTTPPTDDYYGPVCTVLCIHILSSAAAVSDTHAKRKRVRVFGEAAIPFRTRVILINAWPAAKRPPAPPSDPSFICQNKQQDSSRMALTDHQHHYHPSVQCTDETVLYRAIRPDLVSGGEYSLISIEGKCQRIPSDYIIIIVMCKRRPAAPRKGSGRRAAGAGAASVLPCCWQKYT